MGVLLAAGLISTAHAGAFLIRDQSAAGFGMAIAGVAAGDVLSYSFWNPAVLATVRDFEAESDLTAIFPSFDIHPSDATNAFQDAVGGTSNSSVDVGRSAYVPASYIAYPLNDRVTLGVAINSAFGLSTLAPDNWAGQVYSRQSEIFSLNVTPMASYRINDMISVGAGVQLEYFRARLSQAIGVEPDAPSALLRATDDLGVGFNLGVQINPWKGITLGLGYRSSISHDVNGSLDVSGTSTPAKTTLDTPDVLSFGIRQEITERFRVLGTVEWDHWSKLGELPVTGPGGVPLTSLKLDYRDGWLYSVGAEYDYSDTLTLRAGIGYEVAPLTVENRDTRLPETDQFILSAGATYKYNERITLDASYLYSMGLGDGDIDLTEGNPRYLGVPFQATSDLGVSIVSVALRMKLGK
ncbi:transporter [Starkeya sp. ORNL1]|uniref:OmpP1/FadL family transporter n=1 Tax=Starkeya sp. ORNL1 TaxID=2709380 RepID=UPI001463E1F4|nr:outer membrane protein transport protein [Starkeya sp. ORNL1]QJP14040.1 transporter [Starkeya sp. ORNL1]